MPNYNSTTLIGNLTRDPDLRVTPKGTAICQFGLAVNRKWSDNGQDREEVLFIDCEAWAKAGEVIAKYCTKGRPLFVVGRLKLDSWEDKNTKEKRSKIKLVVEGFQFLGGSDNHSGQKAPESTQSVNRPPAQENLDEDDGSVPF